MENFLNFLSNNYLYFLIAAGVLFFALIGFLVDLKKKNKTEESVVETAPVEQTVAPEVVNEVPNPEMVEVPEVPNEVLAQTATDVPIGNVETFNPAPPMPNVDLSSETTPVVDDVVSNAVPDEQAPVTPIENIEEFK